MCASLKLVASLSVQVLVAIEAAPINPSDIGPLFAPSYGGIGRWEGMQTGVDANGRATTSLPLPDRTWAAMQGTKAIGRPNRVGNEGAGRVIGAGKGTAAQALKGKIVAAMGMGGSYSQHAVVNVRCLSSTVATNFKQTPPTSTIVTDGTTQALLAVCCFNTRSGSA